MKTFYTILALLYFCNSSLASVTLVVVSDTWCPYICDDPQSPGYIVELVRDVFKQKNIRINLESVSLARALYLTASNKTDMVLGVTEVQIIEHKLGINTLSVGRSRNDFFVNIGNPWRYTSHSELLNHLGDDKKIGVVKGYNYGDFFDKLMQSTPSIFQVSHGNSPLSTNINMLNAGRIEILIGNQHTVLHSTEPELRQNLIYAGTDNESKLIFVGFAPDIEPEYIKILDKGIIKYRKSGKLKILLDKYDIADWQIDKIN